MTLAQKIGQMTQPEIKSITPDQVRQQIDSAEAFGLGWMLWNAKSVVSVEALDSQE